MMAKGRGRGGAGLTAALVTILVALATGCGGSSSKGSSAGPVRGFSSPAAAGAASGGSGVATGRSAGAPSLGQPVPPAQPQIVRTGDVHVRVGAGRLTESFDSVSGLATGHGGFVSDSDLSPDGPAPSARLVLRVPDDQVNAVLASLGQLGKVTEEQVQGQDVTGQVINLDAQISTLNAEVNAVRTLLAKATRIGDILTIQNQLFGLQTQIQQLTGQQSSLADKTTYATISVELVAPAAAPSAPRPAAHQSTLARAWTLAGHHIVAVLQAVVVSTGWAAPALVVAAAGGAGFVLWRRRRPPMAGPSSRS